MPALAKLLHTKSSIQLAFGKAASLVYSVLVGMLVGPRSSSCRKHLVQHEGVRAVVEHLDRRGGSGEQLGILVDRLSSARLSTI